MSHIQGAGPLKAPISSPLRKALFEYDPDGFYVTWSSTTAYRKLGEGWALTILRVRKEVSTVYHLTEDRELLGTFHREAQ